MQKGQPVLKFQFASKLLKIKERSQENIRKKDQEKELIKQKQALLQAEFESFQMCCKEKDVDIKNIQEIEQNLKRIKDECVQQTNQLCKKLNNTLVQYQQVTQSQQSEIVEQFRLNNSSFNHRHKKNSMILSFIYVPKQTKIPVQQDDEEKLRQRLKKIIQKEKIINEQIIKHQNSQFIYDNLLDQLQQTKQIRNVELYDVKMKRKIIDSQNQDLSHIQIRASDNQQNYQVEVNTYKQNLNIIEMVEKNKLQQMKREDIESIKLQQSQMYDQAIIEKESQIIRKKLEEQQNEMEKLDNEHEEKIQRKAESVQIIEDIEIIHRLLHIFKKPHAASKPENQQVLKRKMSEYQRQSLLQRSKSVFIDLRNEENKGQQTDINLVQMEIKADTLTSIEESHESKSDENIQDKIEYLEHLKEQPLDQHIKINEDKFNMKTARKKSDTYKVSQNKNYNIVIIKTPQRKTSIIMNQLQLDQVRKSFPGLKHTQQSPSSSQRSNVPQDTKKANVSQQNTPGSLKDTTNNDNKSDFSNLQQEIDKSIGMMTSNRKYGGKRMSVSIQRDSERIQIMSRQLQKHKISQTTQQILEKINEFYAYHNDPHQVAEILIKQYNIMLSTSNSLQKVFEFYNHERQVLMLFSEDLDMKVLNLKNIFIKQQNLMDDYQENFSNEKPQDVLFALILNNDSLLELKRKNHMVIINLISKYTNILIRVRFIINDILVKTSNRNEKVFRQGIEKMTKFINEYQCGWFAKRQKSDLLGKEQYIKQVEGVKFQEGGDQQKRIDRITKSLSYTAFYPLTQVELKKQFLEVFPRKHELSEEWLKIICKDILLLIFQSKESLQKGLMDAKHQVGNFNLKKNEFQILKLSIEILQNFSINYVQNLLKQGIQNFSQVVSMINTQNSLQKQSAKDKNDGFKGINFIFSSIKVRDNSNFIKVKKQTYALSPEMKMKLNSSIERGLYHYQIGKKREDNQNGELELNFNKIQKIQNNILQDLKSQQQLYNDQNYKEWINKQSDQKKIYEPFKEGQEVQSNIRQVEAKTRAESFAKLSERERENLYIDHQRTHAKISKIQDVKKPSQYQEQFEPIEADKEEQVIEEVEEKIDDFAHHVNSVYNYSIMFDKLNSIDSKLLKKKEDNSRGDYHQYIPDIIKKDIVKIKRIQSSNLLRKKVLNSIHQTPSMHQTPVLMRSTTAKHTYRPDYPTQRNTRKRIFEAKDSSSSSNESVRLNQFVNQEFRQKFNIKQPKSILRNTKSAKIGTSRFSAKLDSIAKEQTKSTQKNTISLSRDVSKKYMQQIKSEMKSNIFSVSHSMQKKIILSKKLSDIYQF